MADRTGPVRRSVPCNCGAVPLSRRPAGGRYPSARGRVPRRVPGQYGSGGPGFAPLRVTDRTVADSGGLGELLKRHTRGMPESSQQRTQRFRWKSHGACSLLRCEHAFYPARDNARPTGASARPPRAQSRRWRVESVRPRSPWPASPTVALPSGDFEARHTCVRDAPIGPVRRDHTAWLPTARTASTTVAAQVAAKTDP